MEYVPFVLKRAHHATLKLLRPIAARYDLTPARFDLLHAIHSKVRRWPFQRYIAETLGVSRATVCKMIKAMEQAGFVRRVPHIWDARFRRIELTRYGKRCFKRILKLLHRGKIERLVVDAVYSRTSSRAQRRAGLSMLTFQARQLLYGLQDTGDLYRGFRTYC